MIYFLVRGLFFARGFTPDGYRNYQYLTPLGLQEKLVQLQISWDFAVVIHF